MSFERRQPSVDLRAFLDPLKPGEYFDCGAARLYGIDEALEAEALRRGRAVGDDDFQLVATNGGLIFCRASIMFAIAARWKDLTINRPEESNRSDQVLLPISWPTHGDLQFTVSRRLGSNIFRRWLQLQAQATRRSQVEQDVRFERTTAQARSPAAAQANGHSHSDSDPASNGHGGIDSVTDDQRERSLRSTPAETATANEGEAIDLRRLDESDREAIAYATERERRRRGPVVPGGSDDIEEEGRRAVVDPLATLDAAVVDEWVDDRIPASKRRPIDSRTRPRAVSDANAPVETGIFNGDETADPFNGHELHVGDRHRLLEDTVGRDAVRFDVRPAKSDHGSVPEADRHDATATTFMRRTADGTDIYLGTPGADGSGRRPDGPEDAVGGGSTPDEAGSRKPGAGVPVPEISGARLQAAATPRTGTVPNLDIRSSLLSGQSESAWVEMLRRRKMLILGVATIVALGLIALIGFLTGDSDDGTAAEVLLPAEVEAGPEVEGGDGSAGPGAVGPSTSLAGLTGAESGAATIDSTASTLRVTSTSVQICHSNYGGCVPVAADVDCEGDGDGPAFQATPVAVFGDDVYDLDTDDDRQACEADQPRLGAAGGG